MERFFNEKISATDLLIKLYENGYIENHPTEKEGKSFAFKFRAKLRDLEKEGYAGVDSSDQDAPVHKDGRSWSIDPDWFFDTTNQEKFCKAIGIKIDNTIEEQDENTESDEDPEEDQEYESDESDNEIN